MNGAVTREEFERMLLRLDYAEERIATLEAQSPEPGWVICKKAAELLPGSKSTVLRLWRAGHLEGRKLDKVGVILRISSIDKYREQNSTPMAVGVTEAATA